MKSRLNALCLAGSLALALLMTKPAMADEWNKKSEFQFGASVQIPGKVLTPGKYVFEIANSESDRNTVRIFSEDSKGNESLVATIQAIPEQISKTPDKAVIQLEERQAGTPQAIHSWFYPGEDTGWEFIYPKS